MAALPIAVTPRGRDVIVESIKKELAKQEGAPALTDEQMRIGGSIAGATTVLAAVFGTTVVVFAGAGIYWLVFTLGMGRDGRYMQYVAVMSHLALISIPGTAVTIGLQLQSGSLYAAPNVALFLGGRPMDDPLWIALSYVNVFALWQIVAGGIMVGGLTRGSAVKGIAALFGLYLAMAAVLFPIQLWSARMQAGI